MTAHWGAYCDVWWASPDLLRPHHLDLLDETERARLAGYGRGGDRHRFALGVVLVRTAVAAAVNAAPDEVRIDRDCPRCGQPHGRPRIRGHPLHVSVSHSGDVVAAAVTRAGSVGIDVDVMCRFVIATRRLLPEALVDAMVRRMFLTPRPS